MYIVLVIYIFLTCSYIEIDKIVSVKALPGAQQDKTNCTFHVATEGRTYELLAHDEATMNKYVNHAHHCYHNYVTDVKINPPPLHKN